MRKIRTLTVTAAVAAIIAGPAAASALAYIPAPVTNCSHGASQTCVWGYNPPPPAPPVCTNPRLCWGGYSGPVPVTYPRHARGAW